jgi:hypothetical protein
MKGGNEGTVWRESFDCRLWRRLRSLRLSTPSDLNVAAVRELLRLGFSKRPKGWQIIPATHKDKGRTRRSCTLGIVKVPR